MQSVKLEEAVSAVDMPGGQAVQELEYSSSAQNPLTQSMHSSVAKYIYVPGAQPAEKLNR